MEYFTLTGMKPMFRIEGLAKVPDSQEKRPPAQITNHYPNTSSMYELYRLDLLTSILIQLSIPYFLHCC